MVNVNILNNLIEGISKQIPAVNSFYTSSPYESWNVREVKYGSLSFMISNIKTRDTITTYTCTLYYGDRLTEDGSNRDSIWSDSAAIIQTIVGVLNQADEYLSVEYPVTITLFEQDFADHLAGGYATMDITTEGMGECFKDEFEVPQIIGTSSYYTKEEITELFPLKTHLHPVAFTGSYDDLVNKPNVASVTQVTNLYETVKDITTNFTDIIRGKLDAAYFEEWRKSLDQKYDSFLDVTSFDNFVEGQNQVNVKLATEIAEKVSNKYFETVIASLETSIGDKTSIAEFETLRNNVNDAISIVRSDLNKRLEIAVFEAFKTDIEGKVSTKAEKKDLDTLSTSVSDMSKTLELKVDRSIYESFANSLNEAVTNLASILSTKLDANYFEGWKSGVIDSIDNMVTIQSFESFRNNVYTKSDVKDVIDREVDTTFKVYINSDAFIEAIKNAVGADINEAIDKVIYDNEFLNKIDVIVNQTITDKIGEFVTQTELSDAVKDEMEGWINRGGLYSPVTQIINNKLGDYYTADQVDRKFINFKEYFNDYYTKDNVYTKGVIDNKLSNINDRIDSIEVAGVDLSNYYNKNEINSMIGDIETILNKVLYG